MKTKLMLVFAALIASAFAGTLTDVANVFGPQGTNVNRALSTLPVWIETRVTLPAQGLKEYADSQAVTVGPRAFYIVITTQPRQWRISMSPVGIASSEAVRHVGDSMAANFKRGRYADGAIWAALALDGMLNAKPYVPDPKRHMPEGMPKEGGADVWMWAGVATGALVIVGIIMIVVWRRRQAEEREERNRLERLEATQRRYGINTFETPGFSAGSARYQSQPVPRAPRPRASQGGTHIHNHSSSNDGLLTGYIIGSMSNPAPSYRAPDPEPERHRESGSSYDFGSSSSSDSSSSSSDSSSSSSDSSGAGGDF